MSRTALARTGAVFAVLGGLLMSLVATQLLFAIPYIVSEASLGSFANGGPIPVMFTVLSFAGLVAPLALLIGLIGLYALLDASSVAGSGLAVAGVGTLLLFALPILPFGYLFGLSGNPPGIDTIKAMILFSSLVEGLQAFLLIIGLVLLYVATARAQVLGTWRPLLPTIGLLSVLASTAALVLPAIGLDGGSILLEASRFVSGLLWMVLGVAIWRHAPRAERRGARGGTIPANL